MEIADMTDLKIWKILDSRNVLTHDLHSADKKEYCHVP